MNDTVHKGRARALLAGLASIAALLAALAAAGTAAAAPKGVVGLVGSGSATGTLGGEFSNPRGVAVNQSTGDVYVVDSSNHRIQRFDALGNFVSAWGRDVDAGGGTGAEVCTLAVSCQAGATGTLGGEFNSPQGIAVDPVTGDVWVIEQSNRRLQKFTADGSFLLAVGGDVSLPAGGSGTETCTVAADCKAGANGAQGGVFGGAVAGHPSVDENGHLFVADQGNRRVQQLTTAGAFVRAWGWDVQSGGDAAFEVCEVAASCKAGVAGSGAGQFPNNQPNRSAAAGGVVYTVESATTRRVQRFAITGGSPAAVPIQFAPEVLTASNNSTAPTNVAIDPVAGTVLASRGAEGANEQLIYELGFDGQVLETHLSGSGVGPANGLAVHGASGRIYVTTSGGAGSRVLVVGDTPPPPPVATIDAPTAVGETVVSLAGTIDPGGFPTRGRFELSFDGGETWASAGALTNLGAGSGPVPLTVDATGLEANQDYLARVVAVRDFGAGDGSSAEVAFTTLTAAPAVAPRPVTQPQARSVTLNALVDANNQPTTFRFEYGPTPAYGVEVPAGGGDAGDGTLAAPVSAAVDGLEPDTTYHYRLVAENASGTAVGPDRTFRTRRSDRSFETTGRVYELVSSPVKAGGDIRINSSSVQAAAEGGSAVYAAGTAFGDVEGVGNSGTANYRAVRTDDGWSTAGVSPFLSPGFSQAAGGMFYLRFAEDLSVGVLEGSGIEGVPQPEGTFFSTFRQVLEPRSIVNLTGAEEGLPIDPTVGRGAYVGASADLSHILLGANAQLLHDAPANFEPKLYEAWEGGLRYVGILPDGSVAPTSQAAGPYSPQFGGNPYTEANITPDGRRVFFHAPPAPGEPLQLYVRVDGTSTTLVSESEATVPESRAHATLLGTSADGQTVFFTTTESLLDVDSNGARDIYRWTASDDPAGDANLTLVTPDDGPGDPVGVGDVSAIGVSADGATLAFLAEGRLTADAPPVLAPTGFELRRPRAYVWRDGELTHVGALGSADMRFNMASGTPGSGYGQGRLSASGSHLLLLSAEPLLDGLATGGHSMLYLYDVGAGELRCVSCDPAGRESTAPASIYGPGASVIQLDSRHRVRALSDDGRFVFFNTADALVAEDGNGLVDAYQYDTASGRLALLSSGGSGDNSAFLDASADGSEVYFHTRERLTPWDRDGLMDLYVAKIGGGVPPPPVQAGCEGDGCQGPPSAPPRRAAPGSAGPSAPAGAEPGPARSVSGLRLTAAQRVRLARRGTVVVRVRVRGRGRLTVVGRARLGARRDALVLRGARRVARTGTVPVRVRLTRPARARLAAGRPIRVRVMVRLAGAAPHRTALSLTTTSNNGGRR